MRAETLDFPPLHCSHDAELGDYYQDISTAVALVESGYHGSIDERGIPLLTMPGQGEFANAVTCAQYGIANMTLHRRGDRGAGAKARAQLDWLVANQERAGAWAGCWLMRHDNQKYQWLRAPWTGSLASGNAISALLRGWELFGDGVYRESAELAYRGLHAELWYEEYPAHEPLHVLNGHLYTALGVLDHARVTGDPEAGARWERAARTALRHLDSFDLGYWSAYDLHTLEPTNVHYHKNIHIPQLKVLAQLTGESRFEEVAERWTRQLHSRVSHARLFVALRMRRFHRG
jgi:heparosan-N-sulfate-glucuronate 5-epimerase